MSPKGVRSFLGNYLIENGEITEEQLQKALEIQRSSKGKKMYLGQILVKYGYASEEAVTKGVAAQAGVPFVNLREYPIQENAVRLLDIEQIERYEALPIGIEGDRLVVAMAQPRNIIAIDDLRILTGYEIKPVIVTDSELKANIDRYAQSTMDIIDQEEEVEELQDEEEDVISAEADADDRPAVKLANQIISQAVRSQASDVHIETHEKLLRVRFRIDGVLHEVMRPPRKLQPALISRIKVMANMDIAERRVPQDGRITLRINEKLIDVRVASLPTAYGEKLTLRILDRSEGILNLEDLGFPKRKLQKFYEIINQPYGFILVTGPTGSGKSTTLYAILNYLNQVDKHIVTLEDPIERRIDGVNQVQLNRQAGMTFASGLRSVVRNDPDIVMVGEIRDHETARISVESSLTGHLVLSTLHTNDSAGAISRMNDMGIEPYLTASSLVCVLAQRLVRTLCPECKEPYEISRSELLESVPDFPLEDNEKALTLYKPGSCVKCSDTGYRGRAGVFEMLVVSEEIVRMTLERRSSKEIARVAKEQGMTTLREHGLLKVKKGATSLEEVLRVVV